jgi:putative two-component system response regulator
VEAGEDLHEECHTARKSGTLFPESRASKLLIVDDDDLVRMSLQLLLQARGYDVVTAAGGAEALHVLKRKPVDLVLTDLCMPGMDGLQLLEQVKSSFPEVAVILLTTFSSLDTAIRAMRYGASDYLLKPCRREHLLERVEAALVRRELILRLSHWRRELSAITALVKTVEARDPYTRGHSERVAHFTALLAQDMGLPLEKVRELWLAGLLHDIGKVGVRDAVLYKPGPLTAEEYTSVQRHPVLAAEILTPIAGLREVVPTVLHHHERYEGGGYPDGIKGESIPLGARLLAIAGDILRRLKSDGFPRPQPAG